MRVRLDAVVLPSLLLLVARDLVLQQPTRVLAWRALHDARLGALAGFLLPGPPPDLDRDPVALALAALLATVALAYLLADVLAAGRRVRWDAIIDALQRLDASARSQDASNGRRAGDVRAVL